MENSLWSSVKCHAQVEADHAGGGWVQLRRLLSPSIQALLAAPASLPASAAIGGRGFKTAAASVPASLSSTGRGKDPWRE